MPTDTVQLRRPHGDLVNTFSKAITLERILVVDDDVDFLQAMKTLLEEEGYTVLIAEDLEKAVENLEQHLVDLVLSDLVLSTETGIDLMVRVKKEWPEIPFIMLTAHASIPTAVQAMQLGATDYLTKPIDNDELLVRIRRTLAITKKERELRRMYQELKKTYSFANIISRNERMKQIFNEIERVKDSDVTILIQGETGTGKEIVARAIHFQSHRADKPFIALNCAAIPSDLLESELFGHERGAFTGASVSVAGKFELANYGTVFLDEISEMPLELQPKLLRFLEEQKFFRLGSNVERTVVVRIIAATNRNLQELIREKRFREDLFYRLSVMPIVLPPLRDRKEDIPLLAQHFIDEFSNKSKKLHDSALEVLQSYDWKGNVRELRNIMERISLLAEDNEITGGHLERLSLGDRLDSADHLRSAFRSVLQSHDGKSDLLEEMEKGMIHIALQNANGNISEAARRLGIDRKALERRKEKFGL